ncbi:MAG: hypothetical protein KME16_14015 [Scytolyngbya sp. HA4215-MV1]|nr:hypothetical protein [Scytolyngbya sp. HA4215-MV1]
MRFNSNDNSLVLNQKNPSEPFGILTSVNDRHYQKVPIASPRRSAQTLPLFAQFLTAISSVEPCQGLPLRIMALRMRFSRFAVVGTATAEPDDGKANSRDPCGAFTPDSVPPLVEVDRLWAQAVLQQQGLPNVAL